MGIVFLSATAYIRVQQSAYVQAIQLLLAQQTATLISIAEVTDRNGVDSAVAPLVQDCPKRQRFDDLLSKLATLNNKELQEVDQLFEACGDYYVQRKSVMVARFEREYEIYREYLQLLQKADIRIDINNYPADKWKTLVSLEKQRSALAKELVRIQGDIITALLDGVSISSSTMRDMLAEAQEVKDTLAYTGIQIDTLREEIMRL